MSLDMPIRRNLTDDKPIPLPNCRRFGGMAVDTIILARRSVRDFAAGSITLDEFGQLLWAAQGVTDAKGGRTAPSAGATYPLELYAVTGAVGGLPPGLYRYVPSLHAVRRIATGDMRRALAATALSQWWIADAATIIVIAAVFPRTTGKYGRRGERYVQVEAGHAGQNVCLEAVALGLGTTVVGAFEVEAVKEIIGADQPGEPLCLLPVGRT